MSVIVALRLSAISTAVKRRACVFRSILAAYDPISRAKLAKENWNVHRNLYKERKERKGKLKTFGTQLIQVRISR